jgi:hypothetical protein
MSPQIRLHECIGNESRIGLGHAGTCIYSSAKIDKTLSVDARHARHHRFLSAKGLIVVI